MQRVLYVPVIADDQWMSVLRFGGSVLETMVEFTEAVVHHHWSADKQLKKLKFVDVGTGNGVFLHELADLG